MFSLTAVHKVLKDCSATDNPQAPLYAFYKLIQVTSYTFKVFSPLVVSNPLQPCGFSPLGSSVHAISQERIVEWVAIPFSRGTSQPRDQTRVSCIAGQIRITMQQSQKFTKNVMK